MFCRNLHNNGILINVINATSVINNIINTIINISTYKSTDLIRDNRTKTSAFFTGQAVWERPVQILRACWKGLLLNNPWRNALVESNENSWLSAHRAKKEIFPPCGELRLAGREKLSFPKIAREHPLSPSV